MTSRVQHHSLPLPSVTTWSSLGRYYCLATNRHGQFSKSILVTELPSDLRLTRDRAGLLDTEHRVEWEAVSRSDILEWKVAVRGGNTAG